LFIPRREVEAVTQLCQLSGVFMLPSQGKLDLEYLDLLSAYWVVDDSALGSRGERAEEAKTILATMGESARQPGRAGAAP
jgi:hypothetical protein